MAYEAWMWIERAEPGQGPDRLVGVRTPTGEVPLIFTTQAEAIAPAPSEAARNHAMTVGRPVKLIHVAEVTAGLILPGGTL